MRHRAAELLLVIAFFAAAAHAQHPYVGTWKMNVIESKYSPRTGPREQVATISQVGTDLDHRIVGIGQDGSRSSARIVIPTSDGQGRVLEGGNYDAVFVKWFSPQERQI